MEKRIDYFVEQIEHFAADGMEGCLRVEKEVYDFLRNEATAEEAKIINEDHGGWQEPLFLACSAYRWVKAEELVERYRSHGATDELEADVRKFWREEARGSEMDVMRENLPADWLK